MPAWQTFTAHYKASNITGDGRDASAWVFCEQETPLYYQPTGDLITTLVRSKWTTDGVADFELPLPGQAGFTEGFGGQPITDWGFKFWAQPTKSKPLIPGSDTFPDFTGLTAGAVVNVGDYMNIGAWPHATIVTQPPITSGTMTSTETSPGSGAYIVTVP